MLKSQFAIQCISHTSATTTLTLILLYKTCWVKAEDSWLGKKDINHSSLSRPSLNSLIIHYSIHTASWSQMSAYNFNRDHLPQPLARYCFHQNRFPAYLSCQSQKCISCLQCWTVCLQDSTAGTAHVFSMSPTHTSTTPTTQYLHFFWKISCSCKHWGHTNVCSLLIKIASQPWALYLPRSAAGNFICNSIAQTCSLTLWLFGIWFQWFELTVSATHLRTGKSNDKWIDSQGRDTTTWLTINLFSFTEGLV